ncbi:MAG TPA: hypothetical protein VNC50_06575, partial [Planctomycetia bacterium]|nr:hypothetical protein [Planctomycetia bacterium]
QEAHRAGAANSTDFDAAEAVWRDVAGLAERELGPAEAQTLLRPGRSAEEPDWFADPPRGDAKFALLPETQESFAPAPPVAPAPRDGRPFARLAAFGGLAAAVALLRRHLAGLGAVLVAAGLLLTIRDAGAFPGAFLLAAGAALFLLERRPAPSLRPEQTRLDPV